MSKAWPLVKLGEVLIERQETPDSIALDNGDIKVVSKIVFNTGQIEFRADSQTKTGMIQIEPGDLVISGINAAKGAIAIYDEKQSNSAAATIHYGAYSVKHERADIKFLWWLLRSNTFREILNRNLPGGIKTELKAKRLLPIEIPLPPLAEQQRIVAKIERLAGKIEEANKIRSSAIIETETIFQSAIYNVWSNQKSWHKAKIGEVVKIASGQIDPRLEPYASLPHINGESMQAKTGRLLSNYRIAKEDGVTSGKFHFKPGSILYSKIRPYLRKAVIVPFEGICSADVYAIEELDKRINPIFMKYTLISPQFTAYANQKSGRTRMPKLNQNQLFDYIITFPSIEEQSKIALDLDNLQAMTDHLKTIQAQTTSELETMLPSILDRAFKGEL